MPEENVHWPKTDDCRHQHLGPDRGGDAGDLQREVLVDDDTAVHVLMSSDDRGNLEAVVRATVSAAANYAGCHQGAVTVRICDDAAIHEINRQFLQHDYPTDVISFPYAFDPPAVEGELVVSWETAVGSARKLGHPAIAELLLYVAHGCLHLCGYDDQDPNSRKQMRRAEKAVLGRLRQQEMLGEDLKNLS